MPTRANNKQPRTYAVYAIGCQQNWYDAEKVANTCDQLGLYPESADQADLIVILSCSVRQKAVDRLLGFINKWRKQKERLIILTACVLPEDKTKLESKVDHLVPDQEIHDFLRKTFTATDTKQRTDREKGLNFSIKTDHAFVPITIGCNNFCTFCAVPHTRGREQSRPKSLILAEISKLKKQGIENITLLGQNVNSYGLSDFNPRDLRKNKDRSGLAWSKDHPSPFVELLRDIEKMSLTSLSFTSPNPQDISDDLIDWMSDSKTFSRTLNLPLQSGSDRILKKMNRRYNQQEYLELVHNIRKAVPNIIISTDIIVGFPGETDEDFTETLKVVKKCNFAKVFIGIYSARPGTTSARIYKDNIPYKTKHARWSILNDLLNKQPTGLDARTAGRITKDK